MPSIKLDMRKSTISSSISNARLRRFIRLFASLAADPSQPLPYSREMADHRRKYGDSMLRKAADHLAAQEEWELQVREKLDAARQKRQEEKDRISALEASVLCL